MSRRDGRIYTCDRCGEQVFLRLIGKETLDGGFTSYNQFEKLPDGWTFESRWDLCPECSRQYQQAIDQFMGDERIEHKKQV